MFKHVNSVHREKQGLAYFHASARKFRRSPAFLCRENGLNDAASVSMILRIMR
jgi:hypothetical protein